MGHLLDQPLEVGFAQRQYLDRPERSDSRRAWSLVEESDLAEIVTLAQRVEPVLAGASLDEDFNMATIEEV